MMWARIVVSGFCALYGCIAFATGGHAMVAGPDAALEPMLDNTFRFLAAVWVGVGVGFFVAAWDPASHTTLFRVLMVVLVLGGIGRSLGLQHYSPTTVLVVLIALELVPPLFLVPLQASLASQVETSASPGS